MKWELQEGRLWMEHPRVKIFWEVPANFAMPAPALLNLAEYLLLAGLKEQVPQKGQRKFGKRIAMAYSGGVDSTAALRLLPDPLPIYTQVANPPKGHQLQNALMALEHEKGVAVVTNSDELAIAFGLPRGFYGTGGFTISAVLFADYYDLGVIADGNVLETAYLHSAQGHGTAYRKKNFDPVLRRFEAAGLHYCMPCAGFTEVLTTRLARGNPYAMGCMRGVNGQPCGACAKCYRKGALAGEPTPPCAESEKKIAKELIPMLPSLLWAVAHRGLQHPVLDRINKDIDWVDKWYPDALRLIPEHLRPYFLERLAEIGIRSIENDSVILNWRSDRESSVSFPEM